jgi:hypothetical protein
MRNACVIYALMPNKPKNAWGVFSAGSSLMPQVHVKEWMLRRVEVALARRREQNPKFSKADWQREAYAEKLDRELGPLSESERRLEAPPNRGR